MMDISSKSLVEVMGVGRIGSEVMCFVSDGRYPL